MNIFTLDVRITEGSGFLNRDTYKKRVIIYCRQSRDDGGANYHRIETQRELLIDFCRRNSLGNIIKVVMDDDVSGTDFSRFDEIKSMAERRQFDVIVFKDSSRLGRNQIESLMLVKFFEEHSIEIIFENEKFNSDLFPIFAWFNEQRAKDDSLKIRRSLRHKIERGELIIRPHFGYRLEQGRLIFSEDIAVVKKIFRLFLSENSLSHTAHIVGLSTARVRSILRNPVYAGVYTGGVYRKLSFKSKKVVKLPPEDWVVIENHHPAVVPREDFERAARLLELSGAVRKRDSFRGILFCASCGRRMTGLGGKSFVCSGYHSKGRSFCTSHRIRRDDLLCMIKICLSFMCGNVKESASVCTYSDGELSLIGGLSLALSDIGGEYFRNCGEHGIALPCTVLESERAIRVYGSLRGGGLCKKVSGLGEGSEILRNFISLVRRIDIISDKEIKIYF